MNVKSGENESSILNYRLKCFKNLKKIKNFNYILKIKNLLFACLSELTAFPFCNNANFLIGISLYFTNAQEQENSLHILCAIILGGRSEVLKMSIWRACEIIELEKSKIFIE